MKATAPITRYLRINFARFNFGFSPPTARATTAETEVCSQWWLISDSRPPIRRPVVTRQGAKRTETKTASPVAPNITRKTLAYRPRSAPASDKTVLSSGLFAVLLIAKPLILTVNLLNCRVREMMGGVQINFLRRFSVF